MIPEDPVMLLSFMNMKLRDFYPSLLLGGAFSNTYDRLKRKYVVDYFSFGVKWEPLRAIVFNISDFCILIGALIIAIKGM